MKFKAAVLTETKKPLRIMEVESGPLRYGQVLVKVLCSGICGAQINEIDGAKGPDKFLPHLLGHEATATVVEAGEGVSRVAAGDRVVCHWRKAAGIQAPAAEYKSARGPVHSGWVTTFSEYSVISENRLTKVPTDLDPEFGALMGCAATTALGVLRNNARLGVGESLVVFGAGGVGVSLIQLAALAGAFPIVAVDLYDNRLALARKLGATHALNASKGDMDREIRAIVGPSGTDVAVENTGVAEVIELAYGVTAPQGRTVLVGVPAKDKRHPSLYTLPLHFKKILTGSEGGDSVPDADIPRLIRFSQAGRLDFKALIGKRYALDQINEALEDLRGGRLAGRGMVWPEKVRGA